MPICVKLQIKQAHIVGLSMGGGIIAQQLGITFPDIVLSLSLCNTACYASEEAKQKLADRISLINNNSMDFMADFIVNACLSAQYEQKVYDTAFNIFRKNRKPSYIEATKATFSIDFRGDLPNITAPTVICTGEFDKATPISASELINSLIPNSSMIIITGVGHLSKLEDPEAFNCIIFNFIESLARA